MNTLSLSEGEVLINELDDINQCILVIMQTQKGSDPLQPLFGVDLMSWIDRPVNVLIPGLIADITKQVAMWEKRATILQITYQLYISEIIFNVHWKITAGTTSVTTYTYDR